MKKLLMGNEAIALGALAAGVRFCAGYPGTPSTEVLETIAKERVPGVYAEWSVNEKAALEAAAGAAYAGAGTLVTMKQVGLNVASDPLMCLAYIGVRGGTVILVADDPGPVSSQTEQDTRTFAKYSKLPCFDPSSPEEAYVMIRDAFRLSEEYRTPVLFRPTTRLCHASAVIEIDDNYNAPRTGKLEFVRSPDWVIFPRLSVRAHAAAERRNAELSDRLSLYAPNRAEFSESGGRLGVATHGVNYAYVREAFDILGVTAPLLKIATPFPFPYKLAEEFLSSVDRVLCIEELDPVIERELTYLAGKTHKNAVILGKESGDIPPSGENTVDSVADALAGFLGAARSKPASPDAPPLPARPPVLCAGCPHRASFYAVKTAMHGSRALFCGDIGCYTLGNAPPLEMVDTCLCMGAGITIAQGLKFAEPDAAVFAFVGDSTFFASGMTGIANAVYNGHDVVVVVLDNRITAMTGGQPHPGIGETLSGTPAPALSIPGILRAMGVSVRTADPLDLSAAKRAVLEAAAGTGVRAVVFEHPCVNIARSGKSCAVDAEKCAGCGVCVRELGCPALSLRGGTAEIDASLCSGCGLCGQVCAFGALGVHGGTV